MTRESRCGLRGVRVGEASHPGPPRTRARARMEAEAEAEVVLSGLEAAVTRIDDSERKISQSQLGGMRLVRVKTWVAGVTSVTWARVGDVEDHSTVDPTLLDSLAEDLVVPPLTNLENIGRRGSDAVDDCSSVSSESCWGEMEDIGDDEPVLWCVLPDPPSSQADISLEGNRVRPRARRLQMVSSQTVMPSTCNRFAALDEDVDVPHPSESGSLFAGGADVVHICTPRVHSSSEVRRAEHENEAMGTPDDPVSDSSDTESVGSGSSCSAQPDGGVPLRQGTRTRCLLFVIHQRGPARVPARVSSQSGCGRFLTEHSMCKAWCCRGAIRNDCARVAVETFPVSKSNSPRRPTYIPMGH